MESPLIPVLALYELLNNFRFLGESISTMSINQYYIDYYILTMFLVFLGRIVGQQIDWQNETRIHILIESNYLNATETV